MRTFAPITPLEETDLLAFPISGPCAGRDFFGRRAAATHCAPTLPRTS
ncbi:hypothetical protein LMG26411_07906 [Cupriavidus numazuensis]|uniref:Uncharacterized protein n=1 Tax=Cupriavidus numazuensis TaxID=221992 RepID=A0ABM8TW47_9BURK|nr:hypothetical protein LMG26411_07906 [Cupriavidus numazuensis]